MNIRQVRVALLATVAGTTLVAAMPVLAQEQAQGTSLGADDIIVTARKRDETSIAVPVTITAVGAAELQRRAINNIDGIARLVPTLIVGEGGGTVQGGIIAIRGLAGADNNPLNDQAVSFNVDGVGIGRATVRRMSELDIQQVEVLKGPQALFFGKNSPAGIISIRSADPTPDLQAKLSAGYEFEAREVRTEGYVSGPLTDSLGFRVAGSLSDMKGWAKSYVPHTGTANIFPPEHFRAPNKTDWAVRGTLKFDDGGPFKARAKLTYSKVRGTASTANTQFVACPLGRPQGSPPAALGLPIDNCKADNKVGVGDFSPNIAAFDPAYPKDGHTYLHQYQILGSVELNYDLSDSLKLTSVTGYYKVKLRNLGNFTQNYYDSATLPTQILASLNELDLRETSEEVRLASSFDGPVNFMVGGLYQDSYARSASTTLRNTVNPIFVNKYNYVQNGTAYSLFGQMMVHLVPTLELSVGARYSHEKKTLPTLQTAFATAPTVLVDHTSPSLVRRVSFNNLSPEATLSWRPTQDLTLYGSYKEGFLSGGFSALTPTPGVIAGTQQVTYDQQITRGFEGGIKASLLNHALRVNLSAYTYRTTGLQVGVTTMGVQQELRNAGSVRTKGVEFDATYRTPLKGLSLNAAVSYNKGYYLDYQASCYRGQSSSTCFNQVSRVTHQLALLQDLSGQPLVRAPRWSGNAGFNYETPITDGMKIGISGNISHTDKFFTDTTNTPGGLQKGYELVDATIRLAETDDRWELAFIGRNLTNEYYFVRSSDTPFTGTAPGAAAVGVLGDTAASVGRGRELMVRVSYRFGK